MTTVVTTHSLVLVVGCPPAGRVWPPRNGPETDDDEVARTMVTALG